MKYSLRWFKLLGWDKDIALYHEKLFLVRRLQIQRSAKKERNNTFQLKKWKAKLP